MQSWPKGRVNGHVRIVVRSDLKKKIFSLSERKNKSGMGSKVKISISFLGDIPGIYGLTGSLATFLGNFKWDQLQLQPLVLKVFQSMLLPKGFWKYVYRDGL